MAETASIQIARVSSAPDARTLVQKQPYTHPPQDLAHADTSVVRCLPQIASWKCYTLRHIWVLHLPSLTPLHTPQETPNLLLLKQTAWNPLNAHLSCPRRRLLRKEYFSVRPSRSPHQRTLTDGNPILRDSFGRALSAEPNAPIASLGIDVLEETGPPPAYSRFDGSRPRPPVASDVVRAVSTHLPAQPIRTMKLGGVDWTAASPSRSHRALSSRAFKRGQPTRTLLQKTIDSKFYIPAGVRSIETWDDPTLPVAGETGFNARAFTSPVPSAGDYPKKSIKVETPEVDLNLPMGEFGLMLAGKFHALEKREAEQREYIADLESRLVVKNEQYATLSKNFVRIENAHKQTMEKNRDALGRASKKCEIAVVVVSRLFLTEHLHSYSALKSELDELKHSSDSSSLIIAEAKLLWRVCEIARRPAFKVSFVLIYIRRPLRTGFLQELQSMFYSDGRFIPTAETRAIVHELRAELSKTQQVADLLRDKLHTMGSDLAEARTRVVELEESTREERNRSDSTLLQMRQSGKIESSLQKWDADEGVADKIAELTRYLEEQNMIQ
ncbi:hypothetical protein JVU11DRAFT_6735 [Chiua virens]|nr:hypothetical protein JVU11DRAFT_6735 [Chiua virens]